MTLRLTNRDYKIIAAFMKDHEIDRGSHIEMVITIFLDYYKKVK